MVPTLEKVASDALGLSSAGRAELVEKLLASLAGESDPAIERTHLDEVRRRREAVRLGKAQLVEGEQALQHARAAMRQ
mgnify:CR=1 FL=1